MDREGTIVQVEQILVALEAWLAICAGFFQGAAPTYLARLRDARRTLAEAVATLLPQEPPDARHGALTTTELHTWLVARWDLHWSRGVHGHYETLFRVVHEAIQYVQAHGPLHEEPPPND